MRSIASLVFVALPLTLTAAFAACSSTVGTTGGGGAGTTTTQDGGSDAPIDVPPPPDTGIPHACSLPGSVHFTAGGVTTVAGNPSPVDLSFLHLPDGFCAHYYATVGNTRQIRFAPGGELFVASPTGLTTGGGPGGQNAIMVLPDDDQDGVADAPVTFLPNLPKTQGMMFTPGFFYYQDDTKIFRVPYSAFDRKPSTASTLVADIQVYYSPLHWPKPIDIADDGTIYIGNGGDQGEACVTPHPFHGGILKLDGTPGAAQVSKGFRNPIGLRCARGHNQCFALELAKDYTASVGGREKMVPIRQGDDWGFPCCATKDLPYVDWPGSDCSGIVSEDVSFLIGDTPMDLDFAPDTWPSTWAGRAMVATHGAAGSWIGARVVGVAMDPNTGLPLPGTNINGQNMGGMADFATGWDDGTLQHGRPMTVAFARDGRMFLGNDTQGIILWIAPID